MAKKDNKSIKEKEIIPKAQEILEVEEEVKGVVNIDFDEENTPIQTPTKEKKTRYKPLVGLNQEPKLLKTHVLQEKPEFIEEFIPPKIEICNKKSPTLEDLEQEIQGKLRLLEVLRIEREQKNREEEIQKQKEKQEEELKRLSEEIERQEKERKRIEQEAIRKEQQEIEAIKKQTNEIILLPLNEAFLKICPKCGKKIKRSKVKSDGLVLTQFFKCKNKLCDFQKEIVLRI